MYKKVSLVALVVLAMVLLPRQEASGMDESLHLGTFS